MGRGRLHGLDALRGFAALWVLVYHDVLRFPRFMRGEGMDWFVFPGFYAAELGIMPVLWFFLVSGFVIALTVDRCTSGWDFVVRRASRIYPAYWAGLLATAVLVVACPLPFMSLTPHQLFVNLSMMQAYLAVDDLDGVYWSLAVELLFYLYALAFLVTGRRLVAPAAMVWALAALAAAAAARWGVPVSWQLSRLLLLVYGPLLAGGMMLYRLCRGADPARSPAQSPAWSPAWSWATLAVCAAAVALRFHPLTAGSCAVAAGLIAWSARQDSGHASRAGAPWLAARPLAWLGAISYALYVSHQTASFTVIAALDARGVPHGAGIAAGIAAALLLATAITYGIERPAMRAIRRWWDAPSQANANL